MAVYPNSPLKDVACEVRFDGQLEVETQRHLFYNKIRNAYPIIEVPGSRQNVPNALQHYRYRNSEQDKVVSVAINSLAFSTLDYQGHVSFLSDFKKISREFFGTYGITKFERIGWRYINSIPITGTPDATNQVNLILNSHSLLPESVLTSSHAFDVGLETKDKGNNVRIRVATTKDGGQDQTLAESLLLDIDITSYPKEPLNKNGYMDILAKLREHGRGLFEELITDTYRSYLSGEEL